MPIILAHFRMCGELVSLNTLDLNEQQLQLTVQVWHVTAACHSCKAALASAVSHSLYAVVPSAA